MFQKTPMLFKVHKGKLKIFHVLRETSTRWYVGKGVIGGYIMKGGKSYYTSLDLALEKLREGLANDIKKTEKKLLQLRMTHDAICEMDIEGLRRCGILNKKTAGIV